MAAENENSETQTATPDRSPVRSRKIQELLVLSLVIVGLALFILAAVFSYKGSAFLSASVLASLIIGTLMLVGAAFWNYGMVEPKAMYRRGLFWLNVGPF